MACCCSLMACRGRVLLSPPSFQGQALVASVFQASGGGGRPWAPSRMQARGAADGTACLGCVARAPGEAAQGKTCRYRYTSVCALRQCVFVRSFPASVPKKWRGQSRGAGRGGNGARSSGQRAASGQRGQAWAYRVVLTRPAAAWDNCVLVLVWTVHLDARQDPCPACHVFKTPRLKASGVLS